MLTGIGVAQRQWGSAFPVYPSFNTREAGSPFLMTIRSIQTQWLRAALLGGGAVLHPNNGAAPRRRPQARSGGNGDRHGGGRPSRRLALSLSRAPSDLSADDKKDADKVKAYQ